ncbi:MAG TPA: hypothetical protein VM261_21010 [Kofleriaceae bacterium]|nr:hypothetical protein [Kofleriaceae bacterium]
MPTPIALPKLATAPERLFISVDASTGRSTLSYQPATAAPPLTREDDPEGLQALEVAQAIVATYPGCAITGPHFFESAKGRPKRRGRPPDAKGNR